MGGFEMKTYRLSRNYQFANAVVVFVDGVVVGWVTRSGYGQRLYGVVRYFEHNNDVAVWEESDSDFGDNQKLAELWVKGMIKEVKRCMQQEKESNKE
jgi:hypothetical protein